jgi:Polycystin cation channel
MAWLVLLNLFKYSESFNLMNMVLFRASNSVFYFIVGCMPLFLGFVFLVQVVFISVNRFFGMKMASLSLFAMMLGDSVRDFFTATQRQGVIGHLVLMVYMIIFFTAVQNIFIAIVMESYDQVQAIKLKKSERKKQQK